MAATEEEVTAMAVTIKGIQEQLVVINQRMIDFVEHSKMDNMSEKFEARLADGVREMSSRAEEMKQNFDKDFVKIEKDVNVIRDEVTLFKVKVEQDIGKFDDKVNKISETTQQMPGGASEWGGGAPERAHRARRQ